MKPDKPFWYPDTQGFLALSIILLIGIIVLILILKPPAIDERSSGVLMTIVGVLIACLKDVYSFFFGSSKGSEKKDDALISGSIAASSTSNGNGVTAAAKAVVLFLALALGGMTLLPGDAFAQLKRPQITGDVVADTRANLGIGGGSIGRGGPLGDILGALDAKVLPDLQYALKLATASGSRVTAPCWQAWIDIITRRQTAVAGDGGEALALPDPHIITDFEKLVELRNSLQPDSEFMIKCSPVASMVKKDIVSFIGLVITGGAGLAALGL